MEIKDPFAELDSLEGVGNSGVQTSLGQTDHLSSDSNTSFVQHSNGVLVAVTNSAQHVAFRHLDIVEVNGTSARSAYTQFVFFFTDG